MIEEKQPKLGRPPSWTDLDKVKEVLRKNENVADAAQALGTTKAALQSLLYRHEMLASDYLRKPRFMTKIPRRHRIKGNSSKIDAQGKVIERWVKTERASDEPPQVPPVPEGHLVSKVSTFFDAQGEVRAQWVQAPKDKAKAWQDMNKACERAMARYAGLAAAVKRPAACEKDLLTVYPLGDPHIGMYAWGRETGKDFDLRIAERDLLNVVDMLVDRAPASKFAIIANVGDFFHAENDAQLTPTGKNKLDCDNRWAKITEVGFNLRRRIIDRALQKHDKVISIDVPGNHDPQMARMLSFWCKAVYEKEPRVEVMDNANPILYYRFGKVLLGFAHGDGVKPNEMPAVMASERPEDWGATKYRMWVTGHVHHLTRKEHPGCIVESFRTLAPADAWHHWKGYRAGQSLCAITFDRDWGETTRSTVDLRLARFMEEEKERS